jgi:hypothetical protein
MTDNRTCGTCTNIRKLEFDILACPIKRKGESWSVVKFGDTCPRWRTTKRPPKTPVCLTEEQEQNRIIEWCNQRLKDYPELEWIFHVPNGGKRNKPEALRLKTAGVKRGVPDLWLPVPRGKYHGLVIELKRLVGGRVESEQAAWLTALAANGYRAVVCKGADAAVREIENYLTEEN